MNLLFILHVLCIIAVRKLLEIHYWGHLSEKEMSF